MFSYLPLSITKDFKSQSSAVLPSSNGSKYLVATGNDNFAAEVKAAPVVTPYTGSMVIPRPAPFPVGRLTVRLVEGRNFKDRDWFTSMDPYVILRTGSGGDGKPASEQKSSVQKSAGTNPKFNLSFNFLLDGTADTLYVNVMEKDTFSADDHIGRIDIPLREFVSAATRGQAIAYGLIDETDTKSGEIIIACENFVDMSNPPAPAPAQAPAVVVPPPAVVTPAPVVVPAPVPTPAPVVVPVVKPVEPVVVVPTLAPVAVPAVTVAAAATVAAATVAAATASAVAAVAASAVVAPAPAVAVKVAPVVAVQPTPAPALVVVQPPVVVPAPAPVQPVVAAEVAVVTPAAAAAAPLVIGKMSDWKAKQPKVPFSPVIQLLWTTYHPPASAPKLKAPPAGTQAAPAEGRLKLKEGNKLFALGGHKNTEKALVCYDSDLKEFSKRNIYSHAGRSAVLLSQWRWDESKAAYQYLIEFIKPTTSDSYPLLKLASTNPRFRTPKNGYSIALEMLKAVPSPYNIGAPNAPVLCPFDHVMTLYEGKTAPGYPSEGYNCDFCRTEHETNDKGYHHCNGCQILDVCGACCDAMRAMDPPSCAAHRAKLKAGILAGTLAPFGSLTETKLAVVPGGPAVEVTVPVQPVGAEPKSAAALAKEERNAKATQELIAAVKAKKIDAVKALLAGNQNRSAPTTPVKTTRSIVAFGSSTPPREPRRLGTPPKRADDKKAAGDDKKAATATPKKEDKKADDKKTTTATPKKDDKKEDKKTGHTKQPSIDKKPSIDRKGSSAATAGSSKETPTAKPDVNVMLDFTEETKASPAPVIDGTAVTAAKTSVTSVPLLVYAILSGAPEPICRALADCPRVDLKKADSRGVQAIHAAARMGNLEFLKYLIQNLDVDPKSGDGTGLTPAHYAAQFGFFTLVKYLHADAKVDITATNNVDGNSVLYSACDGGYTAIATYLIDDAALPVNSRNKLGNTPLMAACGNSGSLELVNALLERKADITPANERGFTSFHTAAERGVASVVKRLLEVGASVLGAAKLKEFVLARSGLIKDGGGGGWLAMHSACATGRAAVVDVLLDAAAVGGDQTTADAQLNAQTNHGLTPLYYAALNGHTEVVKRLLKPPAGVQRPVTADVNLTSNDNRYCWTPLNIACRQGHTEIVKCLLAAKGVDVNKNDLYFNRPILTAVESNRIEVVKLLLAPTVAPAVDITVCRYTGGDNALAVAERNRFTAIADLIRASPQAQKAAAAKPAGDKKAAPATAAIPAGAAGDPLWLAVRSNDVKAVRALVCRPGLTSAQVNIPDPAAANVTPLYEACKACKTEIVAALLESKVVDVNAETSDAAAGTPLAIACIKNFVEIVKLLVAHPKIDVNKQSATNGGATALYEAVNAMATDSVRVLLSHPKIDVNLSRYVNGNDGTNPLTSAARLNKTDGEKQRLASIEISKLLLAHPNINVNFRSAPWTGGYSFLIVAAGMPPCPELVELAIRQPKIDLNIAYGKPNESQWTPLEFATRYNHTPSLPAPTRERARKCVELLLSVPGVKVASSLRLASLHGHNDVLKMMLRDKRFITNIDRCSSDRNGEGMVQGDSALHAAAGAGQMIAVTALVSAGANIWPHAVADGQSARVRAKENGHTAVAAYLLECEQRVTAARVYQRTEEVRNFADTMIAFSGKRGLATNTATIVISFLIPT